MDANLEQIDTPQQQNEPLSLNDLQTQIKNRILIQFINTVRKPKLNFWAKYSIPGIFILPLVGALILYSFFSSSRHNTSGLLDLAWFMSGVFATAFPIIGLITNFGRIGGHYTDGDQYSNPYNTRGSNIKKYFIGYFNFERELQNYFRSFELPLNTENEIRQYMIDKSDQFFCKKNLNYEAANQICLLTSEEIKQLHDADLNDFQKRFLINKLNQNKNFSLFNLQEIMPYGNVEISNDSPMKIKAKFKKLL